MRDVLAAHILELTGSYEQASYAMQDTSEMVATHDLGCEEPGNAAAL